MFLKLALSGFEPAIIMPSLTFMSFAKFKSQAHFKHIEGRPFCHFPGHNEPMLLNYRMRSFCTAKLKKHNSSIVTPDNKTIDL